MNLHHVRGATAFLAALLFAVPTPAIANAITEPDAVVKWNEHATTSLIVSAGQTPPVAVLHLAMVHGAVYDAVNAIDGRYQPYLGSPSAMSWYSKDAAAVTAAYRVLVSPTLRVPESRRVELAGLYTSSLAAIPPGAAKDGGIAVGDAAATAMIAARADDRRFGDFRFTVPTEPAPGQWVPTSDPPVNDPNAWIARVKTFLIEDPSRFASDGPDALTSTEYATEFAEVKAIGAMTGSTRTIDQSNAATFWAQHPTATWSNTFRSLAVDRGLSITENARLFAMLYLTGADALISCWDDKARWSFWRPVTAIRRAATDGNPATEADPSWSSFIATPPYPDHPSGHGCISGSIVYTLQDFFGTDKMSLRVVRPDNATRSFARFSHAIKEIIDARVWSGIHFRKADVDGANIGKHVAHWRQKHYFQSMDSKKLN
jgi:hypothetical protein